MGSKKEVYRARLQDVANEMKFQLHGGGELGSLEDLLQALHEAPGETYDHHVNEHNNDFSNWIRDCIGDTALAKNLTKVSNQDQACEVVQERLDWLRARI